MQRRRLTALVPAAAVLLVFLSGCVSSRDVRSQSASGSIASPSADPAEVCPALTGGELSRITGTAFQPNAVVDPASGDDYTQCRWAATNGEAILVTKTFREDAESTYKQSFSSAQRNLGLAQAIKVPGALAAFAVPNIGRFGILTKRGYVEVNTIFPSATADVISKILEQVAAAGGR